MLGLDIGTKYVKAAYFDAATERTTVIRNENGSDLFSTTVIFGKEEYRPFSRRFGESPEGSDSTIIRGIRKLVGLNYEEASKYREDLDNFEIIQTEGQVEIEISIEEKSEKYSPEDVLAMVLGHVRERSEYVLGFEIKDAVIAVPLTFSSTQRTAIRKSARLAGFQGELVLINEPTAAAYAHASHLQSFTQESNFYLVYDMGAASFDATLVVVNNSNLDVVVAHGHFDLGGDVIDRHLMDYARKIVRESIEIDPFSDFHFKEQLRMTCQHAKHVLSIADQAKIPFQCKGKSLEIPFPDFSSQDSPSYGKIREAIDRSIAITEKILETAFRIGIQQNQIRILLLGGTSRIPMIRKKLEVFSVAINCQLSPDTAVAEGAARFGQGLAVERVYCLNNRPH